VSFFFFFFCLSFFLVFFGRYEIKPSAAVPLLPVRQPAASNVVLARAKPPPEPAAASAGGWFQQISGLTLFNGNKPEQSLSSEEEEEEGEEEEEDEEEDDIKVAGRKQSSSASWLAGVFSGGSVPNDDKASVLARPPPSLQSLPLSSEPKQSWLSGIMTSAPRKTEGEAEVLHDMLCSWCFKNDARFVLKQGDWSVRAHYDCEHCGCESVNCLGCTDGMARCYDDGADKLCYRCTGLYERVEGKASALGKTDRHCSWCRKRTTQVLHRVAAAGADPRDLYLCEDCGELTVRCEKCPQFARAGDSWRDEKCAVCVGTIGSWEAAAKADAADGGKSGLRSASCSWCLAEARHDLVSRGLLFRSTFRCLSCQNPTSECRTCHKAMARGAEATCASCSIQESWESLREKKVKAMAETTWSVSMGTQQMARNSQEKKTAWEAGLIRPFLFLVSMRPALRGQVSAVLGVPLLGTPDLGDAHREALAILMGTSGGLNKQGIRTGRSSLLGSSAAASTSATTWYHVARRSIDLTFAPPPKLVLSPEQAVAGCKSATDESLTKLEREVMACIAKFCIETGRIKGVDFQREDKEGLHLVLGRYLGAQTGSEEDRAVLLYAWRVVAMARSKDSKEKDDAAEAAKKKKPFPVSPELASLFNAVVIILNQRVLLASEGIEIEAYYE
jgi:hypothetical protein